MDPVESEKHGQARVRKLQGIEGQDAGNHAARAEGRNCRVRIAQPMHEIAGHHGDDCENGEALPPKVILHIVSENEKKVHVADEMPPAAMKQQGDQHGCTSITQRVGGNKSELFNDGSQIRKGTKAHDDTGRSNEPCDDGNVLERAAFLFDGKSTHRRHNFPNFLGWSVLSLLFGHLLDFVAGEDLCSFRGKFWWRRRRRLDRDGFELTRIKPDKLATCAEVERESGYGD